MSRLDRHVAMVQNKLALGGSSTALAWAAAVVRGAPCGSAILVDKVFRCQPAAAGGVVLERAGGLRRLGAGLRV